MDPRYIIIAVVAVALVAVTDGVIAGFLLSGKRKKKSSAAEEATGQTEKPIAAEQSEQVD